MRTSRDAFFVSAGRRRVVRPGAAPVVASVCAVLIALCVSSGCSKPVTQFVVESFKDRRAAQRFSEVFEDGFFCVAPNKNHVFVFEVPPTDVERPAEGTEVGEGTGGGEPATVASNAGNPANEQIRMSQLLQVEVFWRPRPGTTYAESTQTNANIVYCLISGRDCITYEGAGFVSFSESRDGETLTGMIESAALYPARMVNAPADLFGPCRLSGTFLARKDRAAVVQRQLRMQKKLGAPGPSGGSVVENR